VPAIVHGSKPLCTEPSRIDRGYIKRRRPPAEYSYDLVVEMLIFAGIWDDFSASNIVQGLMQLWYSIEEYVRNIGPGTLLTGALIGGAVYYFVVRPR
jgi:hypothetical protein